jgi:Protein tyrosine and serine/threonine kinase
MVLQYVCNEDLGAYLQANTELSWPTKIQMARDIVNGMIYVHNANIIHGNLVSILILLFYT